MKLVTHDVLSDVHEKAWELLRWRVGPAVDSVYRRVCKRLIREVKLKVVRHVREQMWRPK